jgi:uncharacterized protein YndB with AHSA1/START domain
MTRDTVAEVTFPAETALLITRQFSAPASSLYRAWTTPELVKRWMGGEGAQVRSAEIDLHVGGGWRYALTRADGTDGVVFGTYREISPPRRLVYTEAHDSLPDEEALTTVTFAERGAGALVTIRVEHTNPAQRDAHVNSGLVGEGMQASLASLDLLAASL